MPLLGFPHDEALIPAIQGQIPINVKNTHAPEKPGTMIVPEKGFKPENIITGVASGKHFSALLSAQVSLEQRSRLHPAHSGYSGKAQRSL